jgi:hypothetical protein
VELSWFIPESLLDPDYWLYGALNRYEYFLYRDGQLETKVESFVTFASTIVQDLEHSTRYCFDVRMENARGDLEIASNTVCTNTVADLPPTVPQNLSGSAISPAQVDLSWGGSTDDFGLRGYNLYRDGSLLSTIFADRSASDTQADPQTTHCYSVSATDELFQESQPGNEFCITTPPDLMNPTTPASLSARYRVDHTGKHMKVTWSASNDDGLIRYYEVYRDGVHIADGPDNSYADTDIEIETEYCYYVIAVDAANKRSDPSSQSCDTSSWLSSMVDFGGYPMVSDLATDTMDRVHIAYKSTIVRPPVPSKPVLLKHASSSTGTWGGSDLVEDGTDRYHLSIALDTNGTPHIAYSNFQDLKYANRASGGWQTGTIDDALKDIDSVTLKIDASNAAHVCYSDFYQLRFASNRSGSWIVSDIGAAQTTPGNLNCNLALDSAGKIHLSYIDPQADRLLYATNRSGSWDIEVVEQDMSANAIAGTGTSIAVDGAGDVHISYHDFDGDKDLRYATNQSGAWVIETLDSADDVGIHSAIAIDMSGNLHISYGDTTNGKLKYATNKSATWKSYSIDSAHSLPETSIAVDSTGKIHISYSGPTSSVNYATNRDYD